MNRERMEMVLYFAMYVRYLKASLLSVCQGGVNVESEKLHERQENWRAKA